VLEPPNIQGHFVVLMPPGTARTVAAALLAAVARRRARTGRDASASA
jgi:hypothetical protein